ncbi:MAG: hypothetical protein JSS12_11715 [Verrucomicrobia bacterium]|nr:hypothetical protein [Verrucomicrobiota bacterium]
MVRPLTNQNLQFDDSLFEKERSIEVKKDGRTYRFTVTDDGGGEITLEKVKKLVTQTVQNQTIKKQITVGDIVFRCTKIIPAVDAVVKFVKKYIFEPLFGKTQLTKYVTQEFKKLLQEHVHKHKHILDDLRITESEYHSLKIFGEILKELPLEKKAEFAREVLSGAYVQIEDGGKFYDKWVNDENLKIESRHSSHKSSAKQYSFQGPLFKECLFSKKELEDGREVTWFQLERYPAGKLYLIPHLVTWALYRVTGKNQGPHGSSAHTENKNPLVLTISKQSQT